jgi:hypothetical protein
VFTDPQKYGIRVPSLTAGAELVAAAVRRTPAPDAATLAQITALVGVMQLQGQPSFASALAPCAVLMRALLDPRMKTRASERVARALLPQLREHVAKRAPLTPEALAAASPSRRWALTSGLRAVQSWMRATGEHNAQWLWTFRKESGLLAEGETPDPLMSKKPSDKPSAPRLDLGSRLCYSITTIICTFANSDRFVRYRDLHMPHGASQVFVMNAPCHAERHGHHVVLSIHPYCYQDQRRPRAHSSNFRAGIKKRLQNTTYKLHQVRSPRERERQATAVFFSGACHGACPPPLGARGTPA